MKLPESWEVVRIADVLWRVDSKIDPQTDDALTHFYVGLEHIESNTGRLRRDTQEVTESSDILSIKTVFQKGDILYGKLRPNLNKVHLAEQDGICSTDIWALRAADVLLPEFALHYLRSPAIHVRASQIAVGANLPRVSAESFDRIPFPLPSLPEQQRIVDMLRQAETSTQDRQSRHLSLDLMIKAVLDRLVLAKAETEWEQLGELVETRYGTSVSADATAAIGIPVLRIPNIMGGEVDMTDMKYVDLPEAETKRLNLTDADVLIVRSNGNPDYVGRSAPITNDITQSVMVYASYLIRLRADTSRLLPEYLSAFLNSAFGRAAMRNAIRTTAGQSNLSGENLTKVRIPLPSLADQKKFRNFWLEVRKVRQLISASDAAAEALRSALSLAALSGELTEDWRDQHHNEIVQAAEARDALLRDRGAKPTSRPPAPAPLAAPSTEAKLPGRQWVLDELSEFQRLVLDAFLAYPAQPLLAEDPDVFGNFCDSDTLGEKLAAFPPTSPNHIRRTLSQLAALGLIAKITLPKTNAITEEREYLTAFRPLRAGDQSRAADLALLRKMLRGTKSQETYTFDVGLDYETSEHAGAGGMFQVASVTDEEGRSRVDLVDQGKHYASLEEVAADIARALGVAADQIVLEEV